MTKKMSKLDQNLQSREKTELVAIIKLMLQQQPDLARVLQAPLPGKEKYEQPGNSNAALYRQRIEMAVSAAAQHERDRTYQEELKNVLAALQTLGEEFSRQLDTLEALALYEFNGSHRALQQH